MDDVKGEDLFSEKSLWAVYRVCFTRLKRSKFNTVSTLLVFVSLLAHVLFLNPDTGALIKTVRSLADVGIGYGTTVLGFLIAGFTIFATLTKPELLRRMYETLHPSGLNYIKINFYAFIEVFIVYLVLVGICLCVKIFAPEKGAMTGLIYWFNNNSFGYQIESDFWKKCGYVFLSTFVFYSILALKSFVYNTHHAVMTLIVWGLNEENNADEMGETTART